MKRVKLNGIETLTLQALWHLKKATSSQIAEEMKGKNFAYSTLSFALRMLCVKGIVGNVKIDGKQYYFPVLQKSEAICLEIAGVIEKYFQGDVPAFEDFFEKNTQFFYKFFLDKTNIG